MTDKIPLSIDEQSDFEGSWRKIEKYTFIILFILIALSSFGLLNKQSKVNVPGQPLEISYQEFSPYRGSNVLKFDINKPLISNTLHITVDKKFMKSNAFTNISPRAILETVTPQGTEYVFGLDASHMGTVTFTIRPNEAGLHRLSLLLNDEPVSILQFTWP